MHQAAAGEAVAAKTKDWKELMGRIGLVGQGVVATIVGLLTIRMAMGDKDEAATNDGALRGWPSSRSGSSCSSR